MPAMYHCSRASPEMEYTKGRQSVTSRRLDGIDTKGLKPQQNTQGPLLQI
jgi:hypothetical protein